MEFLLGTTYYGQLGVEFADTIGQFSGTIFRWRDNTGLDTTKTPKRIHLPPGISALDRTPSIASHGPRHYLTGGHSYPIVLDEEFRCVRQGMLPPQLPPSVTAGAGSTTQIAYLRYYDELTGERSPLSLGKTITGNTSRTWSSLPTDTPPGETIVLEGKYDIVAGVITSIASVASQIRTNLGMLRPGDRVAISTATNRWATIRSVAQRIGASPGTAITDDTGLSGTNVALVCKPHYRATHLELWLSVSGALPRFVMRVRIGTTSYAESTATLALGEAETASFIGMPVGTMNVGYNDRQVVAGVDGHRDTVFLSAIGFFERYEGLAFKTKYGEPVVGLLRMRDYVMVLCPDSSYILQGYTEDDYSMNVLDADIGGLGHLGNATAEGRAIVPGRKGIKVFNGAFHEGNPTRAREWTREVVCAPHQFEEGFCVVNPNDKTYQFYPKQRETTPDAVTNPWVPGSDRTAHCWVGHYGQVGRAAQADLGTSIPLEWVSDTLKTDDWEDVAVPGLTTSVAYLTPLGSKTGYLYRGDAHGRIWREPAEDPRSATGELSVFHGESIIVPAHQMPSGPGGNTEEGNDLIRLWSYLQAEKVASWVLKVWPGDERVYEPRAIEVEDPPHTFTNGRGIYAVLNEFNELVLSAPKIVWPHKTEKCNGRGFTFEYRLTNPANCEFIGLGGETQPGVAQRIKRRYQPADQEPPGFGEDGACAVNWSYILQRTGLMNWPEDLDDCVDGKGVDVPWRIYTLGQPAYPPDARGLSTYDYINHGRRLPAATDQTINDYKQWTILSDDDYVYIATLESIAAPKPSRVYRLGPNSEVPEVLFTINEMTPRGMEKFGGNLYLGIVRNNAGTYVAEIVKWDGAALTTDHQDVGGNGLTAGYAPVLAAFNSDLYALWTGSSPVSALAEIVTPYPNKIKRRSGGAWTALTMPVTKFLAADWQIYGSALYVSGWTFVSGGGVATGRVLKVATDDTVTLEHTIASPASIQAMVVFNGNLYYVNTHGGSNWLGKYDGVTWNDEYKLFAADEGPGPGYGAPAALKVVSDVYGSEIVAVWGGQLWRTSGANPADKWVRIGGGWCYDASYDARFPNRRMCVL